MSDKPDKPWHTQLPAKLAAIVVFLVALTTLVGNVLELVDKRRTAATPAVRTSTAATAAPPPRRTASALPEDVRLRLDRIVVQHDGSPGTTDWRFTVEVDDEPLLAFRQDALDEQGGRNVAMPDDVEGVLRLAPGRQVKVVVKGWRGSWFKFGAQPDASGEGWLSAGGNLGVIRVEAQEKAGGAFQFHFSTMPE